MDDDKLITLEELNEWLNHIADIAGDDEAAHSAQDNMFGEVLRAIASGKLSIRYVRELAKTALKVYDIEFARWMA